MLLLIDNYDSFTYNLYQYLAELGADVRVVRNDAATVEEVEAMAPERLVVSPGPCTPTEAGISCEVIRRLGPRVPTLGVCLGSQCIGYAFGATVDRAGEIMHGKTSAIGHDGQGLLHGLPNPLEGIRYHSLVVYREGLAGGAGGQRLDVQRADHGAAPQDIPHRGRPVPPGVHHDAPGEGPAAQLPGDVSHG